jgi:hypothetical protein
MKKLFIPLIVIITIISVSCDKIDNPIQTSQSDGPDTSSTIKRRILIEEFTGQLCTYCPGGAREIERLISVYGDQIIPVSIHAGAYANPGNGAWNDFRTTAGDDIFTTFGQVGFPASVISRVNNANVYTPHASWEPQIILIKDDEPVAEITITNSYNTSTREVGIQVDTEWLKNGDVGVDYKLQVFIIEDHIIAQQKDIDATPEIVPNYDHRHMLRAGVNTSWGTAITNTTMNSIDTQNFTYTLDPTWNEANCEVVAFLYKSVPDYEVMQVNIAHVQ